MKKIQAQQGFTIIELVVVILLLGILTATALPRFVDVTDEAHDAAFDGVLGGFSTGVAMYHAQWVGESAAASAPSGWTVAPTSASVGYPAAATPAACETAFVDLLQSGRPELIASAAASANLAAIGALTGVANADFTQGANDTWHATYSTADSFCVLTYIGEDIALTGNRYVTYDPASGNVAQGTF